jgi:DNA-binding NarL/FixJ family response regulator
VQVDEAGAGRDGLELDVPGEQVRRLGEPVPRQGADESGPTPGPRPARSPWLTPRELDVLSAMAEGNTNAAIGAALHLSDSAVEKHINAIFAKLDLLPEAAVHRRVAAVLTYLRAGERT